MRSPAVSFAAELDVAAAGGAAAVQAPTSASSTSSRCAPAGGRSTSAAHVAERRPQGGDPLGPARRRRLGDAHRGAGEHGEAELGAHLEEPRLAARRDCSASTSRILGRMLKSCFEIALPQAQRRAGAGLLVGGGAEHAAHRRREDGAAPRTEQAPGLDVAAPRRRRAARPIGMSMAAAARRARLEPLGDDGVAGRRRRVDVGARAAVVRRRHGDDDPAGPAAVEPADERLGLRHRGRPSPPAQGSRARLTPSVRRQRHRPPDQLVGLGLARAPAAPPSRSA